MEKCGSCGLPLMCLMYNIWILCGLDSSAAQFHVFFKKMSQKWTQNVESFQVSRCPTEKWRSPCERSSKNMRIPGRQVFLEPHSMGQKFVQRGTGHTAERTPPPPPDFARRGPRRKIGRRMLRTMSSFFFKNPFVWCRENRLKGAHTTLTGGPPGLALMAPRGESEGECFAPFSTFYKVIVIAFVRKEGECFAPLPSGCFK